MRKLGQLVTTLGVVEGAEYRVTENEAQAPKT